MITTIAVNSKGKTRRESVGGKEYLVAPLSMVVPGVLSGNKGDLFYGAPTLNANHQQWNNIPIVLGHPKKNGKYVSARSPGILDEFGLGTVFNATFDNKLQAEAWIDIEKANKIDETIVANIEADKPLEQSTGMFTQERAKVGEYNGTSYTHEVTDIRADHLAILVDKTGACSVADGCGLNVNEEAVDALMEEIGSLPAETEQVETPVVVNEDNQSDSSTSIPNDEEPIVANQEPQDQVDAPVAATCSCKKEVVAPVVNETPVVQTFDEWIESAPADAQEFVVNAKANAKALQDIKDAEVAKAKAEVDALVETITSNESCDLSKEQLQATPVAVLQTLAKGAKEVKAPNYSGKPSVTANSEAPKVEGLKVPTMTFGDTE